MVTQDIQCTNIGLCSVRFSSIEPIFEQLSEDLENVIVKENKLYREQNRLTLLSCFDLPRIVDIENVKVMMTFLTKVFGFLPENCQLELFDEITRTEQSFDRLLVFTQGVCVAIIPGKEGYGSQSQYYLVDSHARDAEGKPNANGSGIIIKFEDVLELISYITDIYENNSTLTQYELQFLRIDTKGINKKEIISQIIYKTASNNFQESKCAYSIQKVVQASLFNI